MRVERILWSESQIKERIAQLGAQITRDYAEVLAPGESLLCVGLLKGSFVVLADLVRSLELPVHMDFMQVSSYGNARVSSKDVKILKDLDESISQRHVLLVEDIVDTGRTFKKVLHLLESREPASIRIATLLDKPSCRQVPLVADYVGFVVEDCFVVGYGMDDAEAYRNLPYIAELSQD